jgi:hypothetical protein
MLCVASNYMCGCVYSHSNFKRKKGRNKTLAMGSEKFNKLSACSPPRSERYRLHNFKIVTKFVKRIRITFIDHIDTQ